MKRERVLVIDGDINLLEVLKTRLEAIGYLVDCTSSGNEALDILETRWVDFIVLSIVLQGGMNGYHLFKEIKEKKRLSKIPIIVQSSKSGMKRTFERMGATAFFVKPYSVNVFLRRIRNIIDQNL